MTELNEFLERKKKEYEQPQFVAVSNISEENLINLVDLDFNGIPSPSVQIKPFPKSFDGLKEINSDDSLNSYGEISLIFNQKNIFGNNKTIAKNDSTYSIYAGDAYTIRFPEIEHKLIEEDYDLLIESLDSVCKKVNNGKDKVNNNYLDFLRSCSKKLATLDAIDSMAFKLKYLDDCGLLDKFKFIYEFEYKKTRELPNELKNILKDFSFEDCYKDQKGYKSDEISKYLDGLSSFSKRIILKNIKDEEGEISSKLFSEYFKDDIKNINGKPERIKVYKKTATLNLLNNLLKRAEKISECKYKTFVRREVNWVYTEPKIEDSRKPATPENILNYMRLNRGQGKEQSNVISSLSVEISKNIQKIRSIKELEDNVNQLSDSYEEKYCYIDISSKIMSYAKDRSSKNLDSLYYEKIPKLFSTYKKIDHNDTMKKLLLSLDILDVPDNLIEEFKDFFNHMNNRKQSYYEAKPNNVFMFNHVGVSDTEKLVGIVVPKDIDDDLLTYLEKKTDLRIEMYNPENELSRFKSIYKFRDQFISRENSLKLEKEVKRKKLKMK